ncbi:hypothetical protein [Streptomyces sp. enrichment culture]|uniref:hypothetical protein n=1 Tax=Streptomyces sp. enrichment culture TaxID=1795815 RepID=UPI003F54C762
MERYRAGTLTTPQKRLRAALVGETGSEWQPQVRAQAWHQAATPSGLMVDVTAYFGFRTGSSDDGRERSITTAISPICAQISHTSRNSSVGSDPAEFQTC